MALNRISDMTAIGSSLRSNSLVEISLDGAGSRKATVAEILAGLGIATSTVAGLGAATTANIFKYATDGRKSGEGVGVGTGVMVRSTGSVWQTLDAATTVAA
jgi:hypothetical protein